MQPLTCFKGYDVRGQIGVNLDADIARRIGRGFAHVLGPGKYVVGRDCRATSPELALALTEGIRAQGGDVIDIGDAGTEEVYFATAHLGAVGGVEVTASHNPIDYNGMKFVGEGSRPLDPATELAAIRAAAEDDNLAPAATPGGYEMDATRAAYARHVAGFCDPAGLRPLKVLVNAGNGIAGPAFDAIAAELEHQGAPLTFIRMHHDPDGSFPNGIPNPLLVENRPVTAQAVRDHGADLGVAWDGDFDRCFLFDETGAFIDGEYVVGLLAAAFLEDHPGAKIVHDPRVQWNTQAVVAAAGGQAVVSKTGHAFVKQTMRAEDALYGGEMSAHHYFRDFMFCDSGMIPWVKVVQRMSSTGLPLSALVGEMQRNFPSSGEINFRVADADAVIRAVEDQYAAHARDIDRLDGLSLSFDDWRMNLRKSNTEPLLRLNIEARGDRGLVAAKLAEFEALIASA
ncbi:phosphomannomutase [Actibacterium sp. XHP0104]|uniref:phosphomannomutase n=1 Tax=Actibacterium sp. XHP0104 TaxID=2984335 RepID=UPI0021E7F613|nr:phosphomannomutase [Actibacterium sp. XHP0104]MCV2882221.1 phosphomannomutase [Actibacterium sp. XHP0104]